MTSDDGVQIVYALLALTLVISALAARRLNAGQTVRMALAWIAIFAIGALAYAYHKPILNSLRAAFNPEQGAVNGAGELRVPVGPDGHYWVRARINGAEIRFLVDSGATTTALSMAAAAAAGIEVDERGPGAATYTANGTVFARRIRIAELGVGPIVRQDIAAITAPEFGDTSVLGMNFLSSLRRWTVERDALILTP